MGIINVTPDSFSGNGLLGDLKGAIAQGERFVLEGADILDVGGESTRPGAKAITVEEELQRVIPVIEGLSDNVAVPISIDTYKAKVAEAAIKAGAGLVNDVTGLRGDPKLVGICAQYGVGVVIMHMQGTPRTMQLNPTYKDVVGDIADFFKERIAVALQAGIKPESIIIDPGMGFGKTVAHNLEILRRLAEFKSLGYPLLIGTSRKSFIGKILDLPVDERLEGTAATVAISIANGADMVRVHDVKEMVRVARMVDAVVR